MGIHIFNGISKIHPSHGFSYTVTKAATCTTAGTKSGTCVCGNTDIQSIAATGYTYGNWVVSSDGTTKTRTCSKCGNKETVTGNTELKDADSATKTKYNLKFWDIEDRNIQFRFYGSGSGNYGATQYRDVICSVLPSNDLSENDIIYIPRNIDMTSSDINNGSISASSAIPISINGTNIIPAGYYKIKSKYNRKATLLYGVKYEYYYYYGSLYQQSHTSISDLSTFNWYNIPLGMSSYTYTSVFNPTVADVNTIKTELSNYIEYLGTSYKVVTA